MLRPTHLFAALFATTTLLAASDAGATNYTLWIHGRNPSKSTKPGVYTDFSYWGSSGTAAGVNKKAVNWDGYSSISSQNGRIRDALDCFCTGKDNFCYIAAHSAGDLQIGYALAMYGGTKRNIKNPSTATNGVCSNVTGNGEQVGWNIKLVDVASGAGGGSELANIGEWAVGDPLTGDLKTAVARTLYDHNKTYANMFNMFAGAKGTLYSGVLKGQDDEAVAYHSTCGISQTGGFCNKGDLLCDGSMEAGNSKTSDGVALWGSHKVVFADTGEAYNHHAAGSWAGIVGKVRLDIVSKAK